jgi:hypothetical protein
MWQFTSKNHWFFFAFFMLITIPTIANSSYANELVIDVFITQIEQLKSDTKTSNITRKNKQKKLVRKMRAAKRHAKKSKKLSIQGKKNKAKNQLRLVWNNLYSYRGLLESVKQVGGIATAEFINLQQQSLALLDADILMDNIEILQLEAKLKIDTRQTVQHERIRNPNCCTQ